MNNSRIFPTFSSEQARDVRARAWAYVFEQWHAKKGEHHVVRTTNPIGTANKTTENTESEQT